MPATAQAFALSEQEAALWRERIFEKSIPVPFCGCWIWTGYLNRDGYGPVTVRGWDKVYVYAHRISFAAFHSSIPRGLIVLHRCDTPACVNPDHLFLGNDQDNAEDSARKGRRSHGVRHYAAVLDDEAVRVCRSSPLSDAQLAQRYGVTNTTIRKLREFRSWRHVDASA